MNNFIRQVEGYDEFILLSSLLEGSTSVQDAIQAIVEATMAELALQSTDKRRLGNLDWQISVSVIELAQRTEPDQQSRLAEFMTQLQKTVARDPATDEPLTVDGAILWTNMPSYGYTQADEWNSFSGRGRTDPYDPSVPQDQQNRWARLNALNAQLTQAAGMRYTTPEDGRLHLHALDFSVQAAHVLRMALEEEQSPTTNVDHMLMQAACWWLIFASDRLWENTQHGRMYWTAAELVARNQRWGGFTLDRWEFWQQGLESVQQACAGSPRGELVRRALAAMKRAEEGN